MEGGGGRKVCGEAVTRFATAQIVCQFSTRIATNRRGSTRLECLNLLWAVHAVYSDCMFIALYSRIPYKAVYVKRSRDLNKVRNHNKSFVCVSVKVAGGKGRRGR